MAAQAPAAEEKKKSNDSSISINQVNMTKGRPLSLQKVELKVRMCCTGCERVVKNAILKLRGVESVEVNLEMEKVTVTGYVDKNKVLKAVRRSGKRAEFWPTNANPPMCLTFKSPNNYFKDTTKEYRESYNYWRHGYNDVEEFITPFPQANVMSYSCREDDVDDDKVSNMFNDDNVNSCCLM